MIVETIVLGVISSGIYEIAKTGSKITWESITNIFKDKNLNIEDYGLSQQNTKDFIKEANSATPNDISSKENFDKFITTHIEKLIQNTHSGSGDIINGDKTININTPSKVGKIPKNLTHIPTNDFCLGRDEELLEIENKLENNNSLLLNGIGGIGKSTLAMEYAEQKKDKYEHIAFVEQDGDIKSSFVKAFRGSFKLNSDNPFNDLLFQLQNLEGEKLLIIDNLSEGFKDIEDLKNSFKLLITSRHKLDTIHIYEVEKLSEKNAIELFKKHYQKTSDNEIIKKILNFLDYHTLFIEITAKTLKESTITSIQDILDEFENGSFPQINTNLKEANFNAFLNKLFNISDLQDDELLLLQRLSLFPSIDLTIDNLIDYLCIEDDKKQDFDRTLNQLYKKAWIIKNDNSSKLHQIIKEFLLENHKIEYNQCEDIIINFGNKLSIKPRDNPIDKFKYVSLADSILREINDKKENVGALLNNISMIYQAMGDLSKALEYQEKALSLKKEILGKKHPSLATSYNNISTIYRDMRDLPKALEYQKKALNLREEILGEKHPDLATSYNNISTIYRDMRDLPKALEYQEKDLSLKKEILGEKHPSLATSYNNISLIYQDMGDLSKANEAIDKNIKPFISKWSSKFRVFFEK